jgi:hypothetical protein
MLFSGNRRWLEVIPLIVGGLARWGDCARAELPVWPKAEFGWIDSVAYSPDGKWRASCDFRDNLRLWDVSAGQEVKATGQAAEPQPPAREEYLREQIAGLRKEAKALRAAGRLEEAKQHEEKAEYRQRQLDDLLREKTAPEKPESDNLMVNGSFEKRLGGEPPRDIDTLRPGSQDLLGWEIVDVLPKPNQPRVVERGDRPPDVLANPKTVDWIGPSRWKASHGDHCLDLDGGVRQTMPTKPGECYLVAFDLAGNPEVGPFAQLLRLDIGGCQREFAFDPAGKTTGNLGWTTQHVVFAAGGDRTTLTFLNARPNVHSAGVALDHVVVRPLGAAGRRIRELYERMRRFEQEAEGLRRDGRALEAQQHAERATTYRRQLEQMLQRALPDSAKPQTDRTAEAAAPGEGAWGAVRRPADETPGGQIEAPAAEKLAAMPDPWFPLAADKRFEATEWYNGKSSMYLDDTFLAPLASRREGQAGKDLSLDEETSHGPVRALWK